MLVFIYYKARCHHHELNINSIVNVTILQKVTTMYGKQRHEKVTSVVSINISRRSFPVKIPIN